MSKPALPSDKPKLSRSPSGDGYRRSSGESTPAGSLEPIAPTTVSTSGSISNHFGMDEDTDSMPPPSGAITL